MVTRLAGVAGAVLLAVVAIVALRGESEPERIAALTLSWDDLMPADHDPNAAYDDLVMPEGTEAIPESQIPTGDEPAISQGADDGSDEGWSKVAEVPSETSPPAPSIAITAPLDGEPPMSRFETVPGIPGLDEEPASEPTFAARDTLPPQPPAPVRPDLDGKAVAIAGYMTPLAVEGERVRSFLLVPYVGACIHVPPPPANQIVLVELPEGETIPLKDMWEPFVAVGTLKTQERQTELAEVGYTMQLARIDPYVEDGTAGLVD